jgi:hypothetical protein
MVLGTGSSPKYTKALHNKHEKKTPIEIELSSIMQIFNSFDPAPFHEKELDASAEVYIYNYVGEFPLKTPLELLIYLPYSETEINTEETLEKAIRNHFSYKKHLLDLELRRILQRGRRNLMISFGFLFICLLLTHLLSSSKDSLLKTTLTEGLIIIGWVALWEPVNVFLYGWWPLVQKKNIYKKITSMDIKLVWI